MNDTEAEFRYSDDPRTRTRRAIVGLEMFSTAALTVIALYQTGLLRRLPGPNAERVHGSSDAYKLLETPDALLGMSNYSATACLAGMGPADRPRSLDIALAAKASLDASVNIGYSIREWSQFKAFSPWSLALLGSTLAVAALALPLAFTNSSRVQ